MSMLLHPMGWKRSGSIIIVRLRAAALLFVSDKPRAGFSSSSSSNSVRLAGI